MEESNNVVAKHPSNANNHENGATAAAAGAGGGGTIAKPKGPPPTQAEIRIGYTRFDTVVATARSLHLEILSAMDDYKALDRAYQKAVCIEIDDDDENNGDSSNEYRDNKVSVLSKAAQEAKSALKATVAQEEQAATRLVYAKTSLDALRSGHCQLEALEQAAAAAAEFTKASSDYIKTARHAKEKSGRSNTSFSKMEMDYLQSPAAKVILEHTRTGKHTPTTRPNKRTRTRTSPSRTDQTKTATYVPIFDDATPVEELLEFFGGVKKKTSTAPPKDITRDNEEEKEDMDAVKPPVSIATQRNYDSISSREQKQVDEKEDNEDTAMDAATNTWSELDMPRPEEQSTRPRLKSPRKRPTKKDDTALDAVELAAALAKCNALDMPRPEEQSTRPRLKSPPKRPAEEVLPGPGNGSGTDPKKRKMEGQNKALATVSARDLIRAMKGLGGGGSSKVDTRNASSTETPEEKAAASEQLSLQLQENPSIRHEAQPNVFLAKLADPDRPGFLVKKSCYICRQLKSKGSTTYYCLLCGEAICIRDRKRINTCIWEHLNSSDTRLRCQGPPSSRTIEILDTNADLPENGNGRSNSTRKSIHDPGNASEVRGSYLKMYGYYFCSCFCCCASSRLPKLSTHPGSIVF